MFEIAFSLLWLLALLQMVVSLVLLRQIPFLRNIARLLDDQHHPLPVGSRAPDVMATDLVSDRKVTLLSLLDQPRTLCFLSTDCSSCRMLAEDLCRQRAERLSGLIVLCNGRREEAERLLRRIPATAKVLYRDERDLLDQFPLAGFPASLDVSAQGEIIRYRAVASASDVLERETPRRVAGTGPRMAQSEADTGRVHGDAVGT